MNFFSAPATSDPAPVGAWFTPGRLALLIGCFIFVAYPDVVLGSHSFFYRDFGIFGYPLAYYHRQSFWSGDVPLWNPLNNCGLPFLAQWNTMVFYPLSLIYLLLPLPWSLSFFCLGHLLLAGLGMYFLVDRWTANRFAASVAGLAYALNGLNLHALMWPNNIAALAWMPWVVLVVERAWQQGGRQVVVAALVAATQLLAGAPEIIMFTWFVLGALVIGQLCRRAISPTTLARRLVLVGVIVAALTAVQTLPFLDLLRHSQRDRTFAGEAWAMPPWGWANLVVPLFRMTPSRLGVFTQDEQEWTSSYYVPIGVLALALLALRRTRQPHKWPLAIIAGLGLILALGKNGFVYDWLQRALPFLGYARFPIKFVVLTIFAVPALAALAIASLLSQLSTELPRARRWFMAVAITLTSIVGIIVVVAHRAPVSEPSWSATWQNCVSRIFFLALALGGVYLMARSQTMRAQWLAGLLTLVAIGLDALTHAPRQNPTVTTEAFAPVEMAMKSLPRRGESRAMIHPELQNHLSHAWHPDPLRFYTGMRRSLYANCNLRESVPKVNGFYSLYLQHEAQVRSLLYDHTNALSAGLVDFLGVSQISAPDVIGQWFDRTTFVPFATAGQKPIFADAEETMKGIAAASFDPRRMVYLPLEARNSMSFTNGTNAQIVSSDVRAQEIRLEVKAEEPAIVVIAQAYYHPWKAYVDGAPAGLWRANHAFQALQVPAGRSEVKMVYEDQNFRFGAAISGFAVLSCGLAWLSSRKRTVAN